jgi:hypothetical protein
MDANKNGSSKLAVLDRRIAADMQKRAAEKERLREVEAKKLERQFRTVGEICCKTAAEAEYADFLAALLLVLDKKADAKQRAFLRERGMNL